MRSRLVLKLTTDRLVTLLGLTGLTLLSWSYLLHLAGPIQGMQMGMEAAMPQMRQWGVQDFALAFLMWAMMMIAMMAPSVTPMLLAFVHIQRGRHGLLATLTAGSAFLSGYLMIWTGFSLLAAAMQWGMQQVVLMSPAASITNPAVGGSVLLMAGLYQWTNLKNTCLSQCRTPLGFILTEWREGVRGALFMGLRHGRYCLGCCWALMGLLFVVGIMNLLWVGILAVIVLLEKIAPFGQWLGKGAGTVMIIWGLFVLAASG